MAHDRKGRLMPARSDRKTLGWLEDDKILVADGGMGTTLFGLGLDNGDSPEPWNVDFPDRIAGVHRADVEAADIILTNTVGGSATRLARHGLRDRCRELNAAAARVARDVAA